MYWSGRQIEQPTIQSAAVRLLRRQLHLGQLQPGEQLPAERKLSETFGIARVTLRAALKTLEDEEYLFVRRGVTGGTFVAPEEVLNVIAKRTLLRDPGMAWRLFEFLEANLLSASSYVVARRTPADLIVMERCVDRVLSSTTPATFREALCAFLLDLGQASGNPHFRAAIGSSLEELFLPIDPAGFQHLVTLSAQLLPDLVSGVRRQDAQSASAASVRLLSMISDLLDAGMSFAPNKVTLMG
jgi:GntR family transcriptional repressor for pyruvate dehydrogenase complex